MVAVPICAGLALWGSPAEAGNQARVFVNGVPVPVYFNDGDTFRILDGPLANSPCRLAGFNTLESYGPVHQWGNFHPSELYHNAKMATYNGRRGVWHCTTDGERDGYGRLLTHCPDLAVDQIRRGFAHAMEVEGFSPPEYLRAQQEAIRARRGMWAHGVPDFVLTSLHSASEDRTRPNHYNRMVSVRDGHSEQWLHNDDYGECEWICSTERRVDLPSVQAAARRLREDRELAPQLRDIFNLHLVEFVSRYVRDGELPEYAPENLRAPLTTRLARERAAGRFPEAIDVYPGGCMLYVQFERRYGQNRASCVRGHGNWRGPPPRRRR